jgi:hypothetical protein
MEAIGRECEGVRTDRLLSSASSGETHPPIGGQQRSGAPNEGAPRYFALSHRLGGGGVGGQEVDFKPATVTGAASSSGG